MHVSGWAWSCSCNASGVRHGQLPGSGRMIVSVTVYALTAAGLAVSLPRLRQRLELSRAKHPSLAGHARMARRIAALIPRYEYGEERFFNSDNAPDEIARRRREGFFELAALYGEHFAKT